MTTEKEIIDYYNTLVEGIKKYGSSLQDELPGAEIRNSIADDPADYAVRVIWNDKRYVYKISDYVEILEPKSFLSFILISSIRAAKSDAETIYEADLTKDVVFRMYKKDTTENQYYVFIHPDNIDIYGVICFFKIVGRYMHGFPVTKELADFLEENGCAIKDRIFEAAMYDAANNIDIMEFGLLPYIGSMFDNTDIKMYVTVRPDCENTYFSSSCILSYGFLERTYKKLNRGFYILPSSIHELIIIPDDSYSPRDMDHLLNMVADVNSSDAITENDYLASSVYYFNRNTLIYKTK